MGQVIITIGRLNMGAPGGSSQIVEPNGARSEEVTTSGTAASTTISADDGDFAVVSNNSAGLVWVRFDGEDAAVSDGSSVTGSHPVLPAGVMPFGPLAAGATASVIDDS
jgi:hypothetical protein